MGIMIESKIARRFKKYSVWSLRIALGVTTIVSAQVSHTVTFMQSEVSSSAIRARDGRNYYKISMKGLFSSTEIGMPELPVKHINLLIPKDQGIANIIVTGKQDEEIPGAYKVFPVQYPVPTKDGELPPFVQPNAAMYSSDELYPRDVVQVVRDGFFDGSNHIVTIAVYPIQYNPNTGALIFHSSISLQLQPGPLKKKPIYVRKRSPKAQQIYNSILKNLVANRDGIGAYQTVPSLKKESSLQKSLTVPFYEYVVITSNALKPSFSNFVSWKKRKGWDVGVVTTEEIFGQYAGDLIHSEHPINDDAGKIRQYLSDAYQDGTIWALLGGDHTIVPIRYGCGENNYWSSNPYDRGSTNDHKIPADLYFAEFGGDWNVDGDAYTGEEEDDDPEYCPEIFVGRLVCSSSQDIANWSAKVMRYELNPGDGDVTYVARSFMYGADVIREEPDIVAAHLPVAFSNNTWKEMPSADDPNPTFYRGAEVVSEMNNRYGLFGWFMHGSPKAAVTMSKSENEEPRWRVQTTDNLPSTSPGNLGVSTEETGNGLDNLTNRKYPSVLYSIGCSQTPFDLFDPWDHPGRTMSEGFTVISKAGGPAFLGDTRYGWSGCSYQIFCLFLDQIAAGVVNLGSAELTSKQNYAGAYSHYLNYSHNLVGCPETEMWTATPASFNGVTITDNGTSLTVNAGTVGCDITACSGNDGAQYYLATSDVSSYTFSTSVRPLYITITKHNFIPYTAVTGGTFSNDEEWFEKILVLGDVSVGGGATLTIESGTSVLFANGASLTVNGNLIAGGTVSDAITFDRAGTSGTWEGIAFASGGDGSLTHCTVKNAVKGVMICASSPHISNCTIQQFAEQGIYIINGSPVIQGNSVNGWTGTERVGTGIYVDNSGLTQSSLQISGRNIVKGCILGIDVRGPFGSIEGNFIGTADISAANSNTFGIYLFSAGVIANNKVYGDGGSSLGIGLFFGGGPNHANGNLVDNHGIGIVDQGWEDGSVTSNCLTNNEVHYLNSDGWKVLSGNDFWNSPRTLFNIVSMSLNCEQLAYSNNYLESWTVSNDPKYYDYTCPHDPWYPPADYPFTAGPSWSQTEGNDARTHPELLDGGSSCQPTLSCYPNPFNPETHVQYSVGKPSYVSLKVYDILGREIAVLADDYHVRGLYQVAWIPGSRSTGIYLIKCQIGNEIFVQKALFAK